MSLNDYSWVEGNVPNNVDPSGANPLALAIAACPLCVVAIGVVGAILLLDHINRMNGNESLVEAGGEALERVWNNLCLPAIETAMTAVGEGFRYGFPGVSTGVDSYGAMARVEAGIKTKDAVREKTNDCPQGMSREAAAIEFANRARNKYYLPASNELGGGNIHMAIAVTEVKGSDGICKEYVGISNATGKIWNVPSKVSRWEQAKNIILNIAGAGNVFGDEGFVDYIPGLQGHAETNLYNGLSVKPTAMGTSQAPCGLNQGSDSETCSYHIRQWGISVAYYDTIRNAAGEITNVVGPILFR